MNQQHARMFHKALEILTDATTNMTLAIERELAEDFDSDNVRDRLDALDEALAIVMNARNDFCEEDGIATENGEILWKISDAMKEAEAEGHIS